MNAARVLLGFVLVLSCHSRIGANSATSPGSAGSSGVPSLPTEPGDAFLGNWEWGSGGDVFHVSIWRDDAWPLPHDRQHRTISAILGSYTYTRNGVVVAQTVSAPASQPGLFFAEASSS